MNDRSIFVLLALAALPFSCLAQSSTVTDSSGPGTRTVIAGAEYARSRWYQTLWGRDWRKEWTTPVTVPILNFDSAYGGLSPIREGGGRQTKSLHLRDASGRVWMLRSVNKTYTEILPEIARGSFLEKLANDQVATNHPYAALALPSMAEAAGVYHTNPAYVFVPYHPRLGEYNASFANTLCLLEERPDETQVGNASFGRPEDIVGTEKMLEKTFNENDLVVDQRAYLKTRLFDIVVGDWGRHEDNWRWSKFDSGKTRIYRPVPKDRDQAWAKFEGRLLSLIASAAGLKQLQTFNGQIKNIAWYNYPAIDLDRRFTNALTAKDFLDTARALQAYLTDAVIDSGLRQMPPAIYAASGAEIRSKIIRRRNDLLKYAGEYYAFLAGAVDIPGTAEGERFEIERNADGTTRVRVFPLKKNGEAKSGAIFDRVFLPGETEEIRIYGIAGEDRYEIRGDSRKPIRLRVIGGRDRDVFLNTSGSGRNIFYYDNPGNELTAGTATRIRLSKDTTINRYEYEGFQIDKKGLKKTYLGYKNMYRFYIGLAYSVKKHGWRKSPLAKEEAIGLNFSLVERSLSPYYTLRLFELAGKWNLDLALGYDGVRRVNYYGLGNDTRQLTQEREYHRLRTHNLYTYIGFNRPLGKYGKLDLHLNYDGVQVIDRQGNFVSKGSGAIAPGDFEWKHFIGPELQYNLVRVNDPIVPSKGFNFTLGGQYTMNLEETGRRFTNLMTNFSFYLPLLRPFSLAIKTGAATLSGDAEFYQLNALGGYYTVRGYPRWRFYGKDMVYNQNELRWLPDVRSRIFNGRAGLIALFDQGRVWNPGEVSGTWHRGLGAGFILVPFNRTSVTVTYSVSKDDNIINFHFGTFF